jgi:hypothetical protein
MSFHKETHVKRTRRSRRCNWCREWIDYGEPSVAVAGNYDGDFYSASYHPECSAAISRWSKREGWGDELPDYPMNRGGIEELGEPETEPVDKPVTNAETETEKSPT